MQLTTTVPPSIVYKHVLGIFMLTWRHKNRQSFKPKSCRLFRTYLHYIIIARKYTVQFFFYLSGCWVIFIPPLVGSCIYILHQLGIPAGRLWWWDGIFDWFFDDKSSFKLTTLNWLVKTKIKLNYLVDLIDLICNI